MTLTSLSSEHRLALAMLTTILEQNRVYSEAFGFPSGRICPHCNKAVFASAETLEQLSTAPAGTGLAHDYCMEIMRLKDELAKGPKITLVQLPNPKAQEDDPANPDTPPEPVPTPAPAPADPANPDAQEVPSACA